MDTLPSICIPRTFLSVTKTDITNTFDTLLGKGCIRRIDIINNSDACGRYQRVFVHFNKFIASDMSQIMSKRLQSNQDIKIVYSEPWFWKCSKSRTNY